MRWTRASTWAPLSIRFNTKTSSAGFSAAWTDGAKVFQPAIDMPAEGCYFPPTLLTNVEAASAIAQDEVFGPVLVAMSFRTPSEAVELANNTRYGLAASVWSENISLALDCRAQDQSGAASGSTVPTSLTRPPDSVVTAKSGFGREGGKEGLFAYLRPRLDGKMPAHSLAMLPTTGALMCRRLRPYLVGTQTTATSIARRNCTLVARRNVPMAIIRGR